MKTHFILITIYCLLGFLNIYCYLFQRTVRKIRMLGFGSGNREVEALLYPSWYFSLHFLSFLRYIALIWLAFIDLKLAIIFFAIITLLRLFLPVNDFRNIQVIIKVFKKKEQSGLLSDTDIVLYDLVKKAELRAL